MKTNHRAHRDMNRKNIFFSNEKKPSLCSPKEFPLKDITDENIKRTQRDIYLSAEGGGNFLLCELCG